MQFHDELVFLGASTHSGDELALRSLRGRLGFTRLRYDVPDPPRVMEAPLERPSDGLVGYREASRINACGNRAVLKQNKK